MSAYKKNDALTSFQGNRYFPALDGLRALSVFLVMFNHLHSPTLLFRRLPGWAGVDVFCVLSGFLITTLLLREEIDFGSVRLASFYIRRFFRIVPVFLLVLLAYVPVAYRGEHGMRWHGFKAAVPLYLTFMQDFVPHDVPFSHSWTLGIEEKFYLVWPLLAFVCLRKVGQRAGLAGGLLAISIALFLLFENSSDAAFYQARSYAALLIGSFLACVFTGRVGDAYTRWVGRIPSLIPLALVISTFLLVFENRKFVILFQIAVALLLSSLLLVKSWIREMLASSLPVWIGKRSYSMYLIHLLILNPLRIATHPHSIQGQLLLLVIAYAVTAGVAHLIYLFVEEPMRRYGKQVIRKRQSSANQRVATLEVPS